jgi:hypothetical protein
LARLFVENNSTGNRDPESTGWAKNRWRGCQVRVSIRLTPKGQFSRDFSNGLTPQVPFGSPKAAFVRFLGTEKKKSSPLQGELFLFGDFYPTMVHCPTARDSRLGGETTPD